jgi:hypothetical protein
MYYSYVEIEYVATNFSPPRTDLAVKLLTSEVGPDDTDVGNIAILLSTPKRAQLFPSESSKIVQTEINR